MYTKYIDAVSVRPFTIKLVASYSIGYGWGWCQPALIFDYIRKNIKFVLDPYKAEHFLHPLEVLKSGGGDCDDQANLFASMCISVGIPTRFVRCILPNGNAHLLAEVCYDKLNPQVVVDDLCHHYKKQLNISFEKDSLDNTWIIADPTLCDHLGDIQPLHNSGYLRINPETSGFKWLGDIYYEELKIREAEIQFFESGLERIDRDKRKYKSIFPQKTTRFINWELFLRIVPPDKEIDCTFTAKWYRLEDNFLYAQQEHPFKVAKNWERIWPFRSCGDESGGTFDVGKYRIDIYIESDYLETNKYSAEFEVY